MYDFMEYCLQRYYKSTGWNQHNQYSNLCWWSRSLLDFYTPKGMTLVLSRSPLTFFKPSYTLNALPVLNGSLGYLLTSDKLDIGSSADYQFQHHYLRHPQPHHQIEHTDQAYLLYGRMFFPGALLESMYVRRISKELQCLVTAVSNPASHILPQMAIQLQYDVGKWCTEGSFTSDDGLLGVRALYNIGQPSALQGQWSIGTEAYYGVMDKSGGLSTGVRYSTMMDPSSNAAISFTYTLNPIVGHMSTSYVAQVSPELVLCSRYDFSIYSYESELAFGLEYNATTTTTNNNDNIEKETDQDQDVTIHKKEKHNVQKLEGLIKASWGFNKGLSLMWEGKWRNALISLGLTADSKNPIRSIGFEIQYFS